MRRKDRLNGDILSIDSLEGRKEYDLERVARLIFSGGVEKNVFGVTDEERQLVLNFEMMKSLITANSTDVFFLSIWGQLGEKNAFLYESEDWGNPILFRWTVFCLVKAVQNRVNRLY